MYLEKINSPDDVKKLNVHELEVLAAEMRGALITRLSKHGGHFLFLVKSTESPLEAGIEYPASFIFMMSFLIESPHFKSIICISCLIFNIVTMLHFFIPFDNFMKI